jgi:hypothetical protein
MTNEGNVYKTAKELGMPQNTLRAWRDSWEENGPPKKIEKMVEGEINAFIMQAEEVIDLSLERMKALIPETDVKNIGALGTIVGILNDKVTRAKGLPTHKTEVVHKLPSPDEFKIGLAQYAKTMRELQKNREVEIHDVEIIREQPEGLPKPKE